MLLRLDQCFSIISIYNILQLCKLKNKYIDEPLLGYEVKSILLVFTPSLWSCFQYEQWLEMYILTQVLAMEIFSIVTSVRSPLTGQILVLDVKNVKFGITHPSCALQSMKNKVSTLFQVPHNKLQQCLVSIYQPYSTFGKNQKGKQTPINAKFSPKHSYWLHT